MSKVLLPKEVAEAIENVWDKVVGGLGPRDSVKHTWLTNWQTLCEEFPEQEPILLEYFRENPVNYVESLVNGYEVEQTPEDKLREYIENNRTWTDRPGDYAISERQRYVGRNQGVMMTLSILGITIEGIND